VCSSDLLIATAEGEATRFTKLYNEYAKAPEVTRQRLYLETMQQVYANTSKVLVDSKGGGNLLYLPLDKLMQQAGGTAPPAADMTERSSAPASAQENRDVRTRGQLTRERGER
jgi:membrane protease subunit HflK